jgi:hypothetical protein
MSYIYSILTTVYLTIGLKLLDYTPWTIIFLFLQSYGIKYYCLTKLEECKKTNNTLVQVIPKDSGDQTLTQNPDALNIISKTSCNICPMMAWTSSYIGGFSSAGLSQLGEYETMFLKTGGSAFVLLSEAKSYSSLNNPSNVHGSQYP